MGKEKASNFILTLPLQTEPFQQHILNKRLEVGRKLYNACLVELYTRYHSMKRSKSYQEAIKLPKEDKTRNKKLNELQKKYKLSEYEMHKYIAPMKRHMDSIDAFTAQKVATRCYQAFEKVLFCKSKKAHFKKYGTMESLEGKSNGTGIRFMNNTVYWTGLIMPAIIKPKDYYAQEALTRKIKFCRILKQVVNGKEKFYVQIVFDGVPPVKRDQKTGKIKNTRGNGRVGLDIGTQTIAIASKTDVKLYELAEGLDRMEVEIRRLQRKLDRSRRATNPTNYKSDGTVKKGKHKWIRSNRYMQTLYHVKELHRKYAAQKKQSHNRLANFILSLGDEVYVEDMNFAALAKRAKNTEKNEKGKFKRKKRFGKSILRKSPSMLIGIIDQKLKYQGTEIHKVNTWKVKASQYCHLDDTYKKKPLGKRWNDFTEGKIQRDMYSAFLIMCVTPDLQAIDKERCHAEFENFKRLHDIEVVRLSKKQNLSSMGIKKSA